MTVTHYIYIPGLGDRSNGLRQLALARWKAKDTGVTFVPMNWANKQESYEDKYQRVAEAIQKLSGEKIILVGESAGGAMALLAFSRHLAAVHSVVTICGYNHGARDVHIAHKQRHPAFYRLMPSVDRIVASLDADACSRITTIYSTSDFVVTPSHSHIDGARKVILHTPGHFTNIARVLVRKLPLRLQEK